MVSEDTKKLRISTTNQHELVPSVLTRTTRKSRSKGSWGLCGSWLIIFLISCQSVPRVSDALIDATHLPLEKNASVYLIADVKQSRPIIDLLPIDELKNRQTQQMIDRTNYVAVAMFPLGSDRRFQLVAWGNYPRNASMAFSTNKNWKKQKSATGGDYWHSSTDMLSIAMNARQAFVAGSNNDEQGGTPNDPLTATPGVKIPDEFNDFRKDASLSFWLGTPDTMINRILAGVPIRFPVQEVFINLHAEQDQNDQDHFYASIRMQFENASQARGALSVLNLAVSFLPENFHLTSVLLSNAPVQNGRNIDFKTAQLSKDDMRVLLALLF